MTVTIPDGIATLGTEAVWFVPAIANPSVSVTTAEITAGVALQCAIYAFQPSGEQGTASRPRLCSRDEFEMPGKNKISLGDVEVVYSPQDPTNATTYKAYNMLVPGTKGYIVDRRGLTHETAAAAAQKVDIYSCTVGERNRVAVDPTQDGQEYTTRIKLFASGARYLDKAIA